MTPEEFRNQFESAVIAAFGEHKGTRRDAAVDVGERFKIHPRTVHRIVARNKKTPAVSAARGSRHP